MKQEIAALKSTSGPTHSSKRSASSHPDGYGLTKKAKSGGGQKTLLTSVNMMQKNKTRIN